MMASPLHRQKLVRIRLLHVVVTLSYFLHVVSFSPLGSQISQRQRIPSSKRVINRSRNSARLWMSSREEELRDKIAKLKKAQNLGKNYETVLGKGDNIKDRVANLEQFESGSVKDSEAALRDALVKKGKGGFESELEAGRRTIEAQEDDDTRSVEAVDMVGRMIEIAEENELLDAQLDESVRMGQSDLATGFGGMVGQGEAFFNKQSPLEKYGFSKPKGQPIEEQEEISEENSSAGSFTEATENSAEGVGPLRGSVGGVWSPPMGGEGVVIETRKPAVSTWGVFERPTDMSKAFGGGRDPTQRTIGDEEAQKIKDELTKKLLAKYRADQKDTALEEEEENTPKLVDALSKARRSTRFGDTFGAVSALENVESLCSYRGPMGGQILLELAMALESTGQRNKSQDIYRKLGRLGVENVRKSARRLNYGFQAIDALKYDTDKVDNEVSKIWASRAEAVYVATESRYDSTYAQKDSDGSYSSMKSSSVKEARQCLMNAQARAGIGISTGRVLQAVDFIRRRHRDATRAAEASAREAAREQSTDESESTNEAVVVGLEALVGGLETIETRTKGKWSMALKSNVANKKVDYYGRGKPDTMFLLSGGAAKLSTTVAVVARTDRVGSWSVLPDGQKLTLNTEQGMVGFITAIPKGREVMQILSLDDTAMITCNAADVSARGGPVDCTLWIRQAQ